MSWEKQFKMKKLGSLQKALEEVVELEMKRIETNTKQLIKVLEIKKKHGLGNKTSTSTSD